MDVTLYPDEDWTVDVTHATDVSSVTLTAPGEGQSVRIEAAYSVLAEIARRWAHELGVEEPSTRIFSDLIKPPPVVSAPYKTRTTTLDEIDQKIDNLETLLNERSKEDEMRYPADMEPGGWVQFPPQKAWRRIDAIHEVPGGNFDITYTFGGVIYPQQVRAITRYPYCTAARFAEVCDR